MNKWSKLNLNQLHKQGQKFAETEFVKAGVDVYISNDYHKAIDFVVKKGEDKYYDVQVSSIRENSRKANYVFYEKKTFKPRKNLLVTLLIFGNKELPSIYLIPSLNWAKNKYVFLLDKEYSNKKSKPEWAITLNKSNISEMKKEFIFKKQVNEL